jgi:hypothetical protein
MFSWVQQSGREGASALRQPPFDLEEDVMVRAEIADLGEWLGVNVQAW